jgi:hypothetical protein
VRTLTTIAETIYNQRMAESVNQPIRKPASFVDSDGRRRTFSGVIVVATALLPLLVLMIRPFIAFPLAILIAFGIWALAAAAKNRKKFGPLLQLTTLRKRFGWFMIAFAVALNVAVFWRVSRWTGDLFSEAFEVFGLILGVFVCCAYFSCRLFRDVIRFVQGHRALLFGNRWQHLVAVPAMGLLFLSNNPDLATRTRFAFERASAEATYSQVVAKCSDKKQPAPTFRSHPVKTWACTNGEVEFTRGEWSGLLHGGTWGLVHSNQRPRSGPLGLRSGVPIIRNVTHLAGPWWVWYDDFE